MTTNTNEKPPIEKGPYTYTRERVVSITADKIGTPTTGWTDNLAKCHPTERAKAMRDLLLALAKKAGAK